MKDVKVGDYRRALERRRASTQQLIKSLAFEAIPSLGNGFIDLSSPILILAGANGAGKSTILSSIWMILDPQQASADEECLRKLPSGTLKLNSNKGSISMELGAATAPAPPLEITASYLNVSELVHRVRNLLRTFVEDDDFLNGIGPRQISDVEIAEVNWLTAKTFSSITIYEVEDVGGNFPFFRVTASSCEYDSRSMGAGEMAALSLWWFFDRVPKGTIALLEEPEALLSPLAQETLGKYLIKKTAQVAEKIIITSHSAKLVRTLGFEFCSFVFRKGAGVGIERQASLALLAQIGIDPIIRTVIFVEDLAAKELLRYCLERFDKELSRSCQISIAGGESEITSVLKIAGGKGEAINIIGVYDGDQRGKVTREVTAHAFFLPGSSPIEKEIRDCIHSNVARFERAAKIRDVEQFLFVSTGLDIHDWFRSLCSLLGRSKEQAFPELFAFWITSSNRIKACKAISEDLRSYLGLL